MAICKLWQAAWHPTGFCIEHSVAHATLLQNGDTCEVFRHWRRWIDLWSLLKNSYTLHQGSYLRSKYGYVPLPFHAMKLRVCFSPNMSHTVEIYWYVCNPVCPTLERLFKTLPKETISAVEEHQTAGDNFVCLALCLPYAIRTLVGQVVIYRFIQT